MKFVNRARAFGRRYLPPALKAPLRRLAVSIRDSCRDWRYVARRAYAGARHHATYRAVGRALAHPDLDAELRRLVRRLVFDCPPNDLRSTDLPTKASAPDVLYVTNRLTSDALKDVTNLIEMGKFDCTVLCSNEAGNGHAVRARGAAVGTYANLSGLVESLRGIRARVTIARRGSTFEAMVARLFAADRFIYRPHDFGDGPPVGPVEAESRKAVHQQRAERFLLRTANGLAHIYDARAVGTIRTRYGFRGREIHSPPGCLARSVDLRAPPTERRDGSIHLAYFIDDGRRTSDGGWPKLEGRLHELEPIVRQGLHVHVYGANHNGNEPTPVSSGGVVVGRAHAHLHLHEVSSYAALVHEMSRHDYGLSLPVPRKIRRPDQSEGARLNSFYAYLDAGLPVIVASGHWPIADLVGNHHVGLRVEPRDVGQLRRLLVAVDRQSLLGNVERARKHFALDAAKLIELVHDVGGFERASSPRTITPAGPLPTRLATGDQTSRPLIH